MTAPEVAGIMIFEISGLPWWYGTNFGGRGKFVIFGRKVLEIGGRT